MTTTCNSRGSMNSEGKETSTSQRLTAKPWTTAKTTGTHGRKPVSAAPGTSTTTPAFTQTQKEALEGTGIRNGSGTWALTGSSDRRQSKKRTAQTVRFGVSEQKSVRW